MTLPDTQLYIVLALSVTMVSILGAFVSGTDGQRNYSPGIVGMVIIAGFLLFVASLLSWLQVTLTVWVSWVRARATNGFPLGWHWWTLIIVGLSVLALLILQATWFWSTSKPLRRLLE